MQYRFTVVSQFADGETRPNDEYLVKRIASAYRCGLAKSGGTGTSMWTDFMSKKAPIHDALVNDDISTVTTLLQNPHRTMLFYGFDSLYRDYTNLVFDNILARSGETEIMYKNLSLLLDYLHITASSTSELFDKLDQKIGFHVRFPNPFPNEMGLLTERGIISYRPPQALYQSRRLAQELSAKTDMILEIGAGLGRTAYYSYEAGFQEYTIVDIPITGVAQAFFLGRVLGPDRVCLEGEEPRKGTVRIICPETVFAETIGYDVVLNVDSLTEMDRSIAARYISHIKARAKAFLSVNHEGNAFLVADLLTEAEIQFKREPYPMRAGYFEESARFRS